MFPTGYDQIFIFAVQLIKFIPPFFWTCQECIFIFCVDRDKLLKFNRNLYRRCRRNRCFASFGPIWRAPVLETTVLTFTGHRRRMNLFNHMGSSESRDRFSPHHIAHIARADHNGRAIWDMNCVRPSEHGGCGYESLSMHECLFVHCLCCNLCK
jgi:hypothetical protein